MREAEKVESFGLSITTLPALSGREATEPDQPGLRRMQCQIKQTQPFLEFFKKRLSLVLTLEADNGVVRIADDDDISGRRPRTPTMDPQVIRVMQVDVRQDW